jgi:hypothetical protein
LTLAMPLKLTKALQLRIGGVSDVGLKDRIGRLIDDNRDGQTGGNAIALVTPRAVTMVKAQ